MDSYLHKVSVDLNKAMKKTKKYDDLTLIVEYEDMLKPLMEYLKTTAKLGYVSEDVNSLTVFSYIPLLFYIYPLAQETYYNDYISLAVYFKGTICQNINDNKSIKGDKDKILEYLISIENDLYDVKGFMEIHKNNTTDEFKKLKRIMNSVYNGLDEVYPVYSL